MGYVVLHINKASGNDAGTTAHIERTIVPKNVDPSRTHLNKDLIEYPDGVENRTQAIQHRIENAGITRKIGTNQVRALRVMLSGAHEDMRRIEQSGQLDRWCADSLDWLRKTYGAENIVSATLHRDEKTPHIHATVVPIVTGERRKAAEERKKQEQSQSEGQTSPQAGKKKYRKKNTAAPRLCADDVMTRDNLERFQDTYAEKMSKYGLQRGIKGSEAKHITNIEFHRHIVTHKAELQAEITDLQETKEARQQEVAEHEQQAQEARARTEQATAEKQQAETELAGKQSELQKVKGELKTEKFKSTAAEVGTKIASGIGSMLGTSKVEKLQQEINVLKAENQSQQQEIVKLNQTINRERKESEKITGELKADLNKIDEWLPDTKSLVKWGEHCRNIGFTDNQAKDLIAMKPIRFTGELYSNEHYQRFKAHDAEVRLEKGAEGQAPFRLLINKINIIQWFREKYKEFQRSIGINIKEGQAKGIKIG